MSDAETRMRAAIAERDRQRGRPLTAKEQLDNLTFAMCECDEYCAWQRDDDCECGARRFKAKYGPGKYTP